MVLLAHLSDIHLTPLPPLRRSDYFNKRLTGYLNWRVKRRGALDGLGLTALVEDLRQRAPDFTCVTGDLVNLGLDAEIAAALAWLEGIGPADRVCVCPGNHDAYLRQTLPRSYAAWRAYLSGETLDDQPFPFIRRIGEVAVISCSSAVAMPPFLAAGSFDSGQAARLSRMLRQLGDNGLFRVVLIHHPPTLEDFSYRKGLWGGGRFRRAVAEHGAELVLHGHTHRSTIRYIKGPHADIPVVGVAAAGTAQNADGHADPARYNLFDIERRDAGWACTMREYGFQRTGSDIALRLEKQIY